MKIKFTTSFQKRLLNQIDYIALDSRSRARKFQKDLISKINCIPILIVIENLYILMTKILENLFIKDIPSFIE